ncbi:helix-turn-helix domain-containing protein, partial [Streptomyces swartbergensis]
MSEGTAAADFAALLVELKERSGLSYGVLAKRLHMSTSTLHRYCNGDGVPTDYAPVERLARLCKASPDELVELHRRWVLADAGRGRKGAVAAPAAEAGSGETASAETVSAETVSAVEASSEAGLQEESGEGVSEESGGGVSQESGGGVSQASGEDACEEAGEVVSGGPVDRRRRRPRPALLAAAAVAVVLAGVGLAVAVPYGGADDDGRRGSAAVSDGHRQQPDGGPAASVSPSGSASPGDGTKKGGGKDAASAAPSSSASATGTGSGTGAGADRPGRDSAA